MLSRVSRRLSSSTIISDHTYRNDFDKCVGFIKTFIDQTDAAKAPST